MIKKFLITVSLGLSVASCVAMDSKEAEKSTIPKKNVAIGKASWYAVKCNGGTRTASGKRLIDAANTVAHKTHPMGTILKITNLSNNKSEIVEVTDRGPYSKGRIIDVTIGVAKKLGFVKQGIATVRVEVVKSGIKNEKIN